MNSLPKTVNVNTTVVAVLQEWLHVELAITDQVSLSDFKKSSELRNTAPRGVQKFTGQRVENEVDTAALCLTHNAVHERLIARVEDAVSRDTTVLYQILDFILATHGNIQLRLQHLGNLDSCQTHTTTRTVD